MPCAVNVSSRPSFKLAAAPGCWASREVARRSSCFFASVALGTRMGGISFYVGRPNHLTLSGGFQKADSPLGISRHMRQPSQPIAP